MWNSFYEYTFSILQFRGYWDGLVQKITKVASADLLDLVNFALPYLFPSQTTLTIISVSDRIDLIEKQI